MMKKKIATKKFVVIFLYFLLSFPIGYYAYKYGSPDVGGQKDFYSYYPLYKDYNISATESPFNMRLVGSYLVHLMSKTDIYYNIKICFSNATIEQEIYFDVILFNYISAVFTCFIIFLMIFNLYKNIFFSFSIGLLYFFQYGTIYWGINGCADGFSALLFALFFYCYILRSYWVIPLLALTVFQRDIILITVLSLSFIELLFNKNRKYFLIVFSSSLLFFIFHIILRETIFYTKRWNEILEPGSFLEKAFTPTISIVSYIRQSLINQNILILYLLIVAYKLYNKIEIKKINLIITVSVFLVINIISFALLAADNAGRYFYISSAMLIFYLANELFSLIPDKVKMIE